MSITEEPPPLSGLTGSQLFLNDDMDQIFNNIDEFEDDATNEDTEDEEEEDSEGEYEDYLHEDDSDEEEEGEGEESEESDSSQPDVPKRLYIFHPSDEAFHESDLENRKKRRYLIGTHSFLDLADPHLENALIPADLEAEKNALMTKEEKEKQSLKDEKDHYRNLCEELGVKPEPKVLANLRNSVMNLKGMGMNEKEIIAVCKLLEKNRHVRFLNLSGNSVGSTGGQALAELIQQNHYIAGYDLAGTEILEAFEAICAAIAQNPVITYLNFSKVKQQLPVINHNLGSLNCRQLNELEDMDMPHVKTILKELPDLKTLILYANFIKDDGLRHIGQGLASNESLEILDLSNNKIQGEKKAGIFFTACADHPELKFVTLRRNFITDEGGKGVARILGNSRIEELDASFNLMGEGSAPAIGRSLGRHPSRALKILQLELQRWYQDHGAMILKPFGNEGLEIPITLIDFGMMLDVHTLFLKAKDRALKVHPDVKIIHGQTYGLEHAKGPDHRALIIRKANAVCESFETTLVMLMEELAKEKKILTVPEFRKFIKQCNLYKDKTLTEAFEKAFQKPSTAIPPEVDAEAILEAFDKQYPGLRVIPDPVEDDEEEEMQEKPPKKKGKKGKDKKGGKSGKKGGETPGTGKGGKNKKGGKKK